MENENDFYKAPDMEPDYNNPEESGTFDQSGDMTEKETMEQKYEAPQENENMAAGQSSGAPQEGAPAGQDAASQPDGTTGQNYDTSQPDGTTGQNYDTSQPDGTTGQGIGAAQYGQQGYDQQNYGSAQGGGMYGQQNYDAAQNGGMYGQQNYDAAQNGGMYGQQNYTGQQGCDAAQNGGMYGQQNYAGMQGYGGPGYGMGGVPVDGNGQPLNNRFGMKLTFSILEIICCNPISLVCGIIACIYTTKANNAYKEGKWEEFKSHAKASAISLWIGLGGFVLGIISIIMVLLLGIGIYSELKTIYPADSYYDEFEEYDDSYDDFYDDSYSNDDWAAELPVPQTEVAGPSADIIPQGGFVDPSITINGVYVELPLTYTELKELGFYIGSEDEEYFVNKGEYYFPTVYFGDDEIGSVYIGNATDNAIQMSDGVVFGFEMSDLSDEYPDVQISLSSGVTQDSTVEDVKAAYGEPDYNYESFESDYNYQSYQWYNHSDVYEDMEENSLSIDFWDGKLSDMTILYIGWD